uniref:Tripartite motif-containing protein 34 n=1 Tax=Jaculus jaculus TaxID=51337 RepID=A0A8C5KSH5_JACJA
MAAAVLMEEATCPICLELLTEPVSLDCGHSSCRACLSTQGIGPARKTSCAVCGTRCSAENLGVNRPLAGIVERLREVRMRTDTEKKEDLCVRHGEKLLLFCEEDRKVICWLCERSREHHGHHTYLLEEVATECQEKLRSALERLRRQQREAEQLGADIREERISWQVQIQTERQRIQTGFNRLRSILDSEEQRELRRLEAEERKILHSLAEAEAELAQQSRVVTELIEDLERRGRWSPRELLQDMSGIMKWSEVWTLKKPKALPKKLKTVFCTPDLSGMLQMFRGRESRVLDITLSQDNLNLDLILSEDQRQVTCVPIWPYNCCNYGILGSQYFSSGKHYWEIDVSKKTAWIIGVYCRKRSAKSCVRQGKRLPNVYSRGRPQDDYWVLWLQNETKFGAFANSVTFNPIVVTLYMAIPPQRVGVFLNYEAGTVSFFNITNHGSLIYKFSNCGFPQPVYPYFSPWNCPAPMTLCPPSS